ncbi:MAG: carbon-nitrogen family hydrolase, partial [bacterium]|nr:carbon-nitrogen family hydrolase [bacterium]
YNTSMLFDPEGRLVVTYRKIHLFGFEGGETTLMSSGDELVVVDTPLGPTGLATCYDLRFPEFFRALTEGGATAVLLSSGWPTPRLEHWDVLTRARAIENQVWFIACNEVGTQPGIDLGGHSVVVDPQGAVVAQAGTEQEVLIVDVDPESSSSWREQFPVLKDIRLR